MPAPIRDSDILSGMFRRVLVVLDESDDPAPTLRVARRVASAPEHMRLLLLPAERSARGAGLVQEGTRADQVPAPFQDSGGHGRPSERDLLRLPALDATAIAGECQLHRSDLVVISPLLSCGARERANVILRLATRYGMPVLCVGTGEKNQADTLRRCALAIDGDAPLQALLPTAQRFSNDVALVVLAARASSAHRAELSETLQSTFPGRTSEVLPVSASLRDLAEAMDAAAVRSSADLLLIATDGVSDFRAFVFGLFSAGALQQAQCSALLLPRTQAAPASLSEGLVASDSLALRDAEIPIALEREGVFGNVPLSEADRIQLTQEGGPPRLLAQEAGVITVPADWLRETRGECTLGIRLHDVPAALTSSRVLFVREPLVLVDAGIGPDVTPAPETAVPGARVIFVRLRREDSLRELRQLLSRRKVPDPTLLIDASAWLDDGGAEDVPRAVDAQRLLHLGLRLFIRGAPVAGVVAQDPARPHASVFFPFEDRVPLRPDASAADRLALELDLVSASVPVAGQQVSIELDNAAARAGLLRAIAEAREQIHWQCYIVEDDPVSAELERALAAAAARGVRVRMLVDAVYSRHDVFGSRNPLLVRLEKNPGVEIRTYKPFSGLPDLAALKQRNHRKSIIFDGSAAVITGRNLGAPYYQGFREIALTPTSPYREVPWLDCGALVRGPLVTAVDEAFRREWERAGGSRFELRENAPAGTMTARFIVHDGLFDTRTFDAQLALIRHAQQELLIVNTFPLVIELQRALITAVKRGVRVRVLFGNVRPHFGRDQVFPGGSFRAVADQLVRSRLDAVVNAGGEAYEYAIPVLPTWDPALERVFPHVHAKLLVRDHQDVALGSANFDVTAAYWESEAMLLVHDADFARKVEAAFDPIFPPRVEWTSRIHIGRTG
jgi:phosphatidylserine/phosphatidylglycerophosphate/cardiolipin synthase-like enzyme/nucleotide-binding universal stress UspA family protein